MILLKLFIRDHLLLIILQIVQMLTLISLLWLSDVHEWSIVSYSLLLCSFFLLTYLIYRYVSQRKLYQLLSRQIQSLDESLQPLDDHPLSQAVYQLLRKQYDHFQGEIISLHEKQKEHLIFIDRWVHQMKTPLSVIELMTHDLDEPEASSLREEADRLKTGLTTALYMMRLRNIEHDFNVKRLNLREMIQNIIADQRRLLIRHGIYPKMKIPDDIFVYTDKKWFHFIMSQLIENAVKYSKSHSNRLDILADQSEGATTLVIQDFGIGIPKEDIRNIFKPFYTGKNGRLYHESTGVGLYLVKEISAYLEHDIKVDSKVGEGTRFEIVFE